MSDPALMLSMASAGTLAIGLTATAALRGWQEWLDLRRLEIGARGGPGRGRGRSGARRPEIVELKDRVRRLEAIANGLET